MAVVIGNRIINLPRNNLENLLGGVGDILNAIGTQRKESADRQQITDLDRILRGDVLPADQAGPTRPGITDPQERLNAILATSLKVRNPQTANRLLNVANIQERAIPATSTTSTIGKVSPKDFTAKSLNNFNRSGNFNDLVPIGTAIGNVSPSDFTSESLGKFNTSGNFNDLVRTAKKPSGFQERVEALTPFVGGREEAVKLATGVITTATDPFSKELKIVDLSQRGATENPAEVTIDTSGLTEINKEQLGEITKEASKNTLWELSGLSTGPISSALNAYNKTFALTGLPAAKKTEVARTHLELAGITVTNALSNNSRYPEGLRKWILKQTNVKPSFFKTPNLARQDYIVLNSFVRERIANEIKFLQTTVSPKGREQSTAAIKALEAFRIKLGVPEDAGVENPEIQRSVEADGTVIIRLPDGTFRIEESR